MSGTFEEFLRENCPYHRLKPPKRGAWTDVNSSKYGNISYILDPDERAGTLRIYKGGEQDIPWRADGENHQPARPVIRPAPASPSVRQTRIEVMRAAQALEPKLRPADSSNPYLIKKGLSAYAHIFFANTRGNLMIPVFCRGTLVEFQEIFLKDGEFKKLPFAWRIRAGGHDDRRGGYWGGDKGSVYCIFGEGEPEAIAEGVMTAASVHIATGMTVLCAFNSGNIKKAHISYPGGLDSIRFIAADNDRPDKNGHRAGIDAAAEFCAKYPIVRAVYPENAGDDWNDVFAREGINSVREAFGFPAAPQAEAVFKKSENSQRKQPDKAEKSAVMSAMPAEILMPKDGSPAGMEAIYALFGDSR